MPVVPDKLLFRPRHRLTHAREFQAVYGARCRKSAGPLTVFARPTDRDEPRLGLSVGKKVGKAHVRVAAKRAVREAFRHTQHDLPAWAVGDGGDAGGGRTGRYDLVVQVRAHEPLPATEYQRLLLELAHACHQVWAKRLAKSPSDPLPPARSAIAQSPLPAKRPRSSGGNGQRALGNGWERAKGDAP
ncbi:MAG: ribonuclease P protein component [Phycisphaerales bacterium]|nr:ribonuclease P protein component [Phycisphaerales bacterium]